MKLPETFPLSEDSFNYALIALLALAIDGGGKAVKEKGQKRWRGGKLTGQINKAG